MSAPPPSDRAAALPEAAGKGAEKTGEAPSFDVVRVEPSGDSVIAGRAAPGATIDLLRNGQPLARVVADASGLFAIVPPLLPPGAQEISLQAIAPDGTRIRSGQSVTVVIADKRDQKPLVTVTAPDQPTIVLSRPDEAPAPGQPPVVASRQPPSVPQSGPPPAPGPRPQIRIATVEAEGDGRLFVSGQAAPGATIRLYLNDAFVAPAGTGPDGRLSFSIERGVRPGDYRVRLDDVDPVTGAVKSRAEVPFTVPPPPANQAVASAAPQRPAERPPAASPPPGPATAPPPTRAPPPAATQDRALPAVPSAQPAQPGSSQPTGAPLAPSGGAPAAATAGSPPAGAGTSAGAGTAAPGNAAAPGNVPAPGRPPAVAGAPAPGAAAPGTPAAGAPAAPPPAVAVPPSSAPAGGSPTGGAVAGGGAAGPAAEARPADSSRRPAAPGSGGVTVASTQPIVLADPGRVVVPEVNTTIVSRGDNLWNISKRVYGRGLRYTVIFGANVPQIKDPDLIYPGQVFVLPNDAAQRAP